MLQHISDVVARLREGTLSSKGQWTITGEKASRETCSWCVEEFCRARDESLRLQLGALHHADRVDARHDMHMKTTCQLILHELANSDATIHSGASLALQSATTMSHHLFLLSPSDTPLYSFVHYSSKPSQATSSPLASNLPSWSTSAFAGTFNALSGATSASHAQQAQGGVARIGGQDRRHVIQMIANASLDAIEEVMRKDSVMFVFAL